MSNCEIFGIKNINQNFCMKNKLLKGKYSACAICDKAAGVEKIPSKQQIVPRNNKGKKNHKGKNFYSHHRIVDIVDIRSINTEMELSMTEEQILKRLESTGEDQFIVKSL